MDVLQKLKNVLEESTTQTEIKTDCRDCKEKKAEFDKKMKVSREKWSSLSQTQKDEVYSLLENNMRENNKVLDKLVELKVLEQSDVIFSKRIKQQGIKR